jgi:dTDP-glucose 4,6-dehydratase
MRQGLPKILITGGAGFIGSAFVRLLARDCPRSIAQGLSPQEAIPKDAKGTVPKLIIIDKLTYAGDLKRLEEADRTYKFNKTDIGDRKKVEQIFEKEAPEVIVHFAAESHVDRSILDAKTFMETNAAGTQILLDVSKKYKIKKFIHISTDEVYGEISKGKFTEDSPLSPNSPYAASKAAADLLIKSYIRTYNFPAIIIRPCNNYGPWQYPEKLIPLAILKILRNQKVPIYAKGKNIREWLYVEDCAKGIMQILQKGRVGQIYNLGSNEERENIEVVKTILNILHAPKNMIEFVKDRPGHDIRYRLDSQKTYQEINWRPEIKFEEGIKFTVQWCLTHRDWLFSKWKDIAKLYNYI